MKSLTGTSWGKQKETLVATYKAITRPILEYASTVWSPLVSDSNLQKLQTVQNTALRTATGCTADTNTQHLHQETSILPLKHHCNLHASNLKQKASSTSHPLNSLIDQPQTNRSLKKSLFLSNSNLLNPPTSNNNTDTEIHDNIRANHTQAVDEYLAALPVSKILQTPAPQIHPSEELLGRDQRRLLAQIRAGKSPLLISYLNKIDPDTHPSPNCPLCNDQEHDTIHLFQCTHMHTTLTPLDLWNRPCEASELLDAWRRVLDPSLDGDGGG